MGKTLKKYLLFDLDTTALKEEFGPKRYTVAYSMIRQFLENCGFEHKQGSGYLSTEPISLNQTIAIYQAMTEEMPWLDSCSKTMDVGNVRGFYNLKTLSQNLVADNAVDNSQLELADFDRVFPTVGISHDESMSLIRSPDFSLIFLFQSSFQNHRSPLQQVVSLVGSPFASQIATIFFQSA